MLHGMTDREEFLTWVRTALYEAEFALHDGDAAPRRAIWSRTEPVSVLGAWRNATANGRSTSSSPRSAKSFSDCTSYAFELLAYDVIGDMAYTAGLEHTSASVDGQPRTYTLASHPGVPAGGRRMAGRPPPWRHPHRVTTSDADRVPDRLGLQERRHPAQSGVGVPARRSRPLCRCSASGPGPTELSTFWFGPILLAPRPGRGPASGYRRARGAMPDPTPITASPPTAGTALPVGTVTFLFTDIEGSTRLLQQAGEAYGTLLDDHRRLLRAAFAAHAGREVDTQGDSFFVVFSSPGGPSPPRPRRSRPSLPTPGPRRSRSGCGWGCTPARSAW